MTPNEITTVMATALKKTFDTPFKLMLMERVTVWRSRLIKNSLDKTPADRKFFRQTVYLSLEKVPQVSCNLPVDICDVARTATIPPPLRANSILFDYVGAINGANPFKELTPGMMAYFKSGKYSKNLIGYLYTDGKIEVYGNANLPMLRMDYIGDNPEDFASFACSPDLNKVCDFWNQEYPCPGDILQQILQFIAEVDFGQKKDIVPEISAIVNPENDIQS
jgi:hypothetical protein